MKKNWKIFVALWLMLVAFVLFYKGIRLGWNDTKTDFNNYYASAKLIQKGESIHAFYSNDRFKEMAQSVGVKNGAKFSPFPPPTAVLYWPLSFFDLLTAKRIWLVFNLLLLVWLPFRMKRYFRSPVWENALTLSLFVIPLSSNLHFGQFYFVTAFVLVEAIGYFLVTKKSMLSSVLIGVLASVKYVPILFLGYLMRFSKESMKPIFTAIATVLVITGIFVLIDFEAYGVYLHDLGGHVNGDLSGQGKYAIGFQSLDALFNNLFVADAVENPKPFFEAAWLKPVLKWMIVAVVGMACFLMLRKEKYAFSPSTVSVGIIGVFVIIPASASYHFLLLILPIFFILRWLVKERSVGHFLITIALIFGAFSIQAYQIPSMEQWPFVDLLIHFPRLWLIVALFSFLVYCKQSVKNS